MTFDEFESTLAEMVGDIPDEFLTQLQGIHALPEAKLEPHFHEVYRLGEYMDPGPGNFLGAGEGLGRHIALYYGSFAAIAQNDPTFDWDAQLWETLTHELRHHVESQAGDVSLIEDDLRRARAFRQAGR